jgi:hypothetical protein
MTSALVARLSRVAKEPPFRLLAKQVLSVAPVSVRVKSEWDAVSRPNYLAGVLAAADQAGREGISEVSVIEFGVAGGQGLLALQKISEAWQLEQFFQPRRETTAIRKKILPKAAISRTPKRAHKVIQFLQGEGLVQHGSPGNKGKVLIGILAAHIVDKFRAAAGGAAHESHSDQDNIVGSPVAISAKTFVAI